LGIYHTINKVKRQACMLHAVLICLPLLLLLY